MAIEITGGPGDTGGAAMAAPLGATLDLDKVVRSKNVCDLLTEEQLSRIGNQCADQLNADLASRADWADNMAKIMALAMQVAQRKTSPWVGASNVKFPLLSIAALQYHARAYQSLCPSDGVVRYQVFGQDPDNRKHMLGQKLCEHMNWQLLERSESWEEGLDRLLLIKPIVGCVFRKLSFDPVRAEIVSDLVYPMDLVVNYYAKDLDTAPAVTHYVERSENYVWERQASGHYREVDLKPTQAALLRGPLQDEKDRAQKLHPSSQAGLPLAICEQCCWLDLDGDGYKEPYIVVFERGSRQVLRIIPRFKPSGVLRSENGKNLLRIVPVPVYVKWGFIPSPDGSLYDIGFGNLLYPINESINTVVNQLIDSGTLANTAGGFLGRGVKIRAGQNLFQPFGWNPVDSTGDDLRKNIFPLPVREPNAVLFNLLKLLIDYGERTGSAPEQSVGVTPGQNTPAETSRNAALNAERVLNSVLKRAYRSLRMEFRVLYDLNAAFLDDMQPNPFGATSEWYSMDPLGIRPAADPAMLGETMPRMQAMVLDQQARSAPGYNLYAVQKRVLQAYRVPNIEEVLPDPKGPNAIPPPPNPKVMDAETKRLLAQVKFTEIQAKAKAALSKAMVEVEKADAEIRVLHEQARNLAADTDNSRAAAMTEAMRLRLEHETARRDGALAVSEELRNILEMLHEPMKEAGNDGSGMGAMAKPPGDAGPAGAPA